MWKSVVGWILMLRDNGSVVAALRIAPLMVCGLGCGQVDRPQSTAVVDRQPAAPAASGPVGDAAIRAENGAEQSSTPLATKETWDAVYMGESKIGFVRTLFETVTGYGQTCVRASSWSELEIVRYDQRSKLSTHVQSWETETGEVRALSMETRAGPSPILVEGKCHESTLDLVISTEGKELRKAIPWDRANGGFFALEQSLTRRPMQPGETRKLTSLMPGLTGVEVVTSLLTAEALEDVVLLDKTRQLLRIRQQSQVGGLTIDSLCWADPQGDVLKTTIPGLNQTIIRTTREMAQAAGATGEYDLGWETIVKVNTPLPHPHQLTKVVYEVSLSDQDPVRVFVGGGSQMVESVNERVARITVLAVRPQSPETVGPEAAPRPEDLEPNSLIQADDPQIRKLAADVAGEQSDAWDKCVELEKWVHGAIETKNFGQGFATATDVARSLEGDCTEHAVLLAALCRAQAIPARVAVGLVYSVRDQGFAFHMWNEVWVADRWIPVDATLGLGGIGAAHVRIAHSSLGGTSAETALLSVVQVINQLTVKILQFQPQ